MKGHFQLHHESARQRAVSTILSCPLDGTKVTLSDPNRTLDQNAAQWPILECFSEQKLWVVNGQQVKLEADDWKDILTAAFKKETVRIAQGIDGGMVMLGHRTSKFSKKEFSEYLEFLHATAAQMGVQVYGEAA
jgi:hypothetical protein